MNNEQSTWRTVQLFLSPDGVNEVEVDSSAPNTMRCDCSKFKRSNKCKHTIFVREMMMNEDGRFTVHIPSEIEDEDAVEAMETPEKFRLFVIKYGKVEVL